MHLRGREGEGPCGDVGGTCWGSHGQAGWGAQATGWLGHATGEGEFSTSKPGFSFSMVSQQIVPSMQNVRSCGDADIFLL